MPGKTLILLFSLSLIATLLIGVNIGKRLGVSQYLSQYQPPPTILPTITLSLTPTFIFPSPTISLMQEVKGTQVKSGTSTYTDENCGFIISYLGSYLQSKSVNGQTTIITDPNNPGATVVTTCQQEIPAPPLPPDKIENITLDGVSARLYHDASSQDGSPRDEVIVKHPTLNHEIIIAGYGPTFSSIISSFKFIR